QPVALSYKASDKARLIEFRGYAYTRTPSEISGRLMTRYDESKPQIWKIPLREDVQPDRVVTAPSGGYVVPAAHAAWVAARLRTHGVEFHAIERALPAAAVETFRAAKVTFDTQSFEAHQRLDLEGEWQAEARD